MKNKKMIGSENLKKLRCGPTEFLDDIIDMMAQLGESAIAVTGDRGQVLGILTDHDIMRAINACGTSGSALSREHVFDWMSEYVCSCENMTALADAASLMKNQNIHHLIITKNDRFFGIASLSEVLQRLHLQDLSSLKKARQSLPPIKRSRAA